MAETGDVQAQQPHRRIPIWALLGVLVSIALALALNADLIFDATAQRKWSTSPDSVAITQAALAADGAKVASWWYGPWIEGEMYYRPLSSMLMWLEARAFGWNFLPYNIISWLVQAGIAGLIFLLLYRLCPGPQWQRALAGATAAACFVGGHHPAGPDDLWIRARVTWGVMPWWPVQTDICSLFAALVSLILLDRWLVRQGSAESGGATGLRGPLPLGALVWFLIAVLFKETPLTLVAMAPVLAAYRRGPWLRLVLVYGLIGLAFLAVRHFAVPAASNPEWLGGYTFYKYWLFVHLEAANLLAGGETWEWVAVLTYLLLAVAMRRLRLDWLYVIVAVVVWPFIWAAALTGNPMLATIPRELGILARFLLVYGGLLLAIMTWRREPVLLFVACILIVAAPNVNRIGPHYWYWPVAFWGMANGAALNAAVNAARDWWTRREVKAAGAAASEA